MSTLLDRLVGQVEREACLHDEHVGVRARAQHLDRGEGREGDLVLGGVLPEPAQGDRREIGGMSEGAQMESRGSSYGDQREMVSCTCESQSRDAPRSTMPWWISSTMPQIDEPLTAYCSATERSTDVERNAVSTPPRTLCRLGVHISRGSVAPETPR